MPTSPQPTIQTRNPVLCKESDQQSSTNTLVSQSNTFDKDENFSETLVETLNEYRRMFFLPSELNVNQIVDNPKVKFKSKFRF